MCVSLNVILIDVVHTNEPQIKTITSARAPIYLSTLSIYLFIVGRNRKMKYSMSRQIHVKETYRSRCLPKVQPEIDR